jgi:glycine/D-amino acid oxidase-like deaminating enzyme
MSGILTLYHILQTSPASALPRILLLDARSLCSGATGRNGGHAKIKVATLTSLPSDASRNALQAYISGVTSELKNVVDCEDGLSEECEFEMRRSFDVFQDEAESAHVKSIWDAARNRGEEWTKGISWISKDMAEQVTSIQGAVGAFSMPAVSMWPYKFVAGLLERMVRRYDSGTLNVQMDTPVTHISRENVLSTPRGDVRAGKIVFATNAWTAGLLADFEGTITPYKGMNSHHKPERRVHPHLNNTYNIFFAKTQQGRPTGVDYLNPRPDGGIVVGGGGWHFKFDRPSWWNNFDDSMRFSQSVEKHWDKYMHSTFLGWEHSNAVPDMVWTGIMGYTNDEKPHIGRVPSKQGEEAVKNQWILAGFNGGGMSTIPTAAKAVAKMVVENLGFEDVKQEFGLLEGFGTTVERQSKRQVT